MIKCMIPANSTSVSYCARWDFEANQIKYSPMHWLAYWDDSEAIAYLLNNIPQTKESYSKILRHNNEGMTPIDIAGKHKSNTSALLLLKFLTSNFSII